MDEAFAKAEKEIASYKSEREKEIDQKVADAVAKASRELLGHSIDLSAHTDLVIKALAQAKKEYGF